MIGLKWPLLPITACRIWIESEFEITIVNPKHISIIKPNDDGSSLFQLEMTDSRSLGPDSYDGSYINEFMRKVLLACNLTMKKAAFSITLTDPSRAIMDAVTAYRTSQYRPRRVREFLRNNKDIKKLD